VKNQSIPSRQKIKKPLEKVALLKKFKANTYPNHIKRTETVTIKARMAATIKVS
jgi:hypothetical protein